MGLITPTFNDKANGMDPLIGEAAVEAKGNLAELVRDGATVLPMGTPPVAPVAEVKPLKIAVVGTAPSSRMLAPYNDPAWTIWACSPGNMNVIPRADAWFEIHGNLLWPENEHYGRPYLEWLNKIAETISVYMQNQNWVPKAKVFPKDELVAEFGRDFFSSTFAWMIAYALKQPNIAHIAMYGVDMASRDEYILQRPAFYFWRYLARQRGVEISAPHESDIMQSPPLYGYADVTPFGRKLLARKKEIRDRLTHAEQQAAQIDNMMKHLRGALEDMDYFETIWLGQG